MATHSSILAWEIPWTEEHGGLQSMGSRKSQNGLATDFEDQDLSVSSVSCDPMNCSPPGSSVQWISQGRILEWVAIPFSRGYS